MLFVRSSEVRSGSVDWGVNLEICDLVAHTGARCEESLWVLERARASRRQTLERNRAVGGVGPCTGG